MKKRYTLCVLLAFCLLLCSCGRLQTSEPEQVLAVSAVGVDALPSGELQLTLELPRISGGEGGGEEEPILLEGSGQTLRAALEGIARGLSRELIFSHCALLVLGESLDRPQMAAVFDFAGEGTRLPLAAQVVSAPDARLLLSGGSMSAPAAGYEIAGIFRRQSRMCGLESRSRIYELYAGFGAGRAVIPHFTPAGEEATERSHFSGLRILQNGVEPITVSAEETVGYAMLSGELSDGGAISEGGLQSLQIRENKLAAELTADGRLQFTLTLKMTVKGAADAARLAALQQETEAGMAALFERLRAERSADCIGFAERLQAEAGALWATVAADYPALFAGADFRAVCTVSEERGMLV